MHTSTRLVADDFSFWQHANHELHPPQRMEFATFSPDYHPQDRVGVVSMGLEDGVLHTSYALLALTTAFYDRLRAHSDDFFDYPQHFAFVGAQNNGESGAQIQAGNRLLAASTPQLWNAWSWLDVWPDAKWVTAPANASAMLRRSFDYQINRLFWPRTLTPALFQTQMPSNPVPGHLWKMLKSSLKAVYLYGNANDEAGAAWEELSGERVEIRVLASAREIVQESLVQLPASLLIPGGVNVAEATIAPQVYERIAPHAFLASLQGVGQLEVAQ